MPERRRLGWAAIGFAVVFGFIYVLSVPEHVLKFTGDVICYTIAFAAALFMVLYQWSARWYRSPEGRNIMGFAAGVLVFALLNSTAIYFGPQYFGRYGVRVMAYSFILYQVVRRTTWLNEVQIKGQLKSILQLIRDRFHGRERK